MWPSISDYQTALQNTDVCFDDPQLKGARTETGVFGSPLCFSGRTATVWPLRTKAGRIAVRTFQRHPRGLERRYAVIAEYMSKHPVDGILDFEYVDRGIRVGGHWRPLIKMPWVDGMHLNAFVREHVDEPQTLQTLADRLRIIAAEMNRHHLAHGDWQHANILVRTPDTVMLTDHDGFFVPGLEGLLSPNLGHPNYQHPDRTSRDFGPHLDRFSARLIVASLRLLQADPELWRTCGAGNPQLDDDCLLFRAEDLRDPGNSSTFRQLRVHHDRQVRMISEELIRLLHLRPVEVPPLTAPPSRAPAVPEKRHRTLLSRIAWPAASMLRRGGLTATSRRAAG